jgi:hypothetical protein
MLLQDIPCLLSRCDLIQVKAVGKFDLIWRPENFESKRLLVAYVPPAIFVPRKSIV